MAQNALTKETIPYLLTKIQILIKCPLYLLSTFDVCKEGYKMLQVNLLY
jgi:hypothetical protein